MNSSYASTSLHTSIPHHPPAPARGARGLAPAALVDLARAWGADERRWRAIVRHPVESRWYALLEATPDYEIWLLAWAPGQGIELHDHGAAAGVLYVAEGALVEQRAERGGAERLRERRLGAGCASAFDVGEVHGLCNIGLANATSIHVYAPRLEHMTFFDRRAAGVIAAVRSETLPEVETIP